MTFKCDGGHLAKCEAFDRLTYSGISLNVTHGGFEPYAGNFYDYNKVAVDPFSQSFRHQVNDKLALIRKRGESIWDSLNNNAGDGRWYSAEEAYCATGYA